ncbi:hypothetical protein KPSA1_05848 [Pseudomonas syringae pv. actinidiae]|uniref:Uncharacterized protein n=1 Tax=Pseudomonas syringae pv. actinidiae TaxID=103796 RepID=A0A2V0QGX0_PSESF|nr:hypothetical protein KPSA1_05848 [Pseudomonas syringae pv. actinidiae]
MHSGQWLGQAATHQPVMFGRCIARVWALVGVLKNVLKGQSP